MRDPDIEAAYALKTPQDSQKLYADWAESYDAGFAESEHYILHMAVARAFAEAGGQGPVLDVGAGTGLCGQALATLGIGPLVASDISPEMLAVARGKALYDRLFVADVTQPLAAPEVPFAGIVSSGTFTTGHVGPPAIGHMLDVAAPGALFALSINTLHYRSAGFEAGLQSLKGQIRDLRLPETRIYGAEASGPHKDDTALIALFHKV